MKEEVEKTKKKQRAKDKKVWSLYETKTLQASPPKPLWDR